MVDTDFVLSLALCAADDDDDAAARCAFEAFGRVPLLFDECPLGGP